MALQPCWVPLAEGDSGVRGKPSPWGLEGGLVHLPVFLGRDLTVLFIMGRRGSEAARDLFWLRHM